MAQIYNLVRRPNLTNGAADAGTWLEYADRRLATSRNASLSGNMNMYGDEITGLFVSGSFSDNGASKWTTFDSRHQNALLPVEGEEYDLYIEIGSPIHDSTNFTLHAGLYDTANPSATLREPSDSNTTFQGFSNGDTLHATLVAPAPYAPSSLGYTAFYLVLFLEDGQKGNDYVPVAGVRLSPVNPGGDNLGVFDGNSQRDGYTFHWTGEENKSASYAELAAVEPIAVEALPPEWIDNATEGGGTWTTPEIEGVTYTPATGVAEPGETVTVTATALEGYAITGATEWTHSYPVAPEPEPDPEPEPGDGDPVPSPELSNVAANVAKLLGIEQRDTELFSVVTSSAEIVTMMVYGYTRGRGFTVIDGVATPVQADLIAVITAATSRLAANPSGLRYRAGTETVSDAFNGWTLAERYILDRYRKRWA